MSVFVFFNDTATTEIYTLSLHDALPISPSSPARTVGPTGRSSSAPGSTCWPPGASCARSSAAGWSRDASGRRRTPEPPSRRSEEHTSELQSRQYLVCRLLLEKKKNINAI